MRTTSGAIWRELARASERRAKNCYGCTEIAEHPLCDLANDAAFEALAALACEEPESYWRTPPGVQPKWSSVLLISQPVKPSSLQSRCSWRPALQKLSVVPAQVAATDAA